MVADIIAPFDHELARQSFFDDPYATYRRLRRDEPVYWSALWNSWLLTRYDDIVEALRDHDRYSNRGRQASLLGRLSSARQAEFHSLSSHYQNGGMSNQDPPNHTRLRGLVNLALTPRVVAELESRIQQTVDELLDAIEITKPFDFMEHFANVLPAVVIGDLLGLPQGDHAMFQQWSNEITAFLGTGTSDDESARRGQEAMQNLRSYLGDLIQQRLTIPSSDFLGRFAEARHQGDRLSENEMIGSCVTLLLGGHETTRNLLGNGLLALLKNPEQMEVLRNNPTLTTSAVEEFLRYDAPVQRVWRIVKQDTHVNGRQLRAGDSMFLMVGAANRDESRFAKPDQLLVSRQQNRHLTFGLGIHFCLGSALARLEARIAFSSLFKRFGRVTLTQNGVVFHPNIAFRGLISLPIVCSNTGEGG
jgi:cytochrome P450